MNWSPTVNRAEKHGSTVSLGKVATAIVATLICFIAIAIGGTNANAAFNVTAFKMQPQAPASATGPTGAPAPYQAGGHPSVKFNIDPDAALADGTNNSQATGDDLKKVTYEFPAGALGNPNAATTKCADADFALDKCPVASYIGSLSVPLRIKSLLGYTTISSTGSMYVMATALPSDPITVGFIVRPAGYRIITLKSVVKGVISYRSSLDDKYGLNFSVDNIPRTISTTYGSTVNATISNITVILNSRSGGTSTTTPNGAYFTYMPTRCTPALVQATMTSYGVPTPVTQTKTDSFTPTNCLQTANAADKYVPFQPTASVTPSSTVAGDPVSWTANFTNPNNPAGANPAAQTAQANIEASHIQSITTDLPLGTQLNSSEITAIGAVCDEVDVNADTCPASSKIGTASAYVPLLPGTNPNGNVNGSSPTFGGGNFQGDVYVISKVNGITFAYIMRGPNGIKTMVRGWVAPVDSDNNGSADFIRAFSEGMPQAPFSPAQIKFDTKLVKNAATCGPQLVKTTFKGWNGATVVRTNSYNIDVCGPVAPDTALVSGPTGLTKLNQPTWTFSATPSAGSTFQSNLDNAGYVAMAGSTFTPSSPLSDGPHNLKVRACNSTPPSPCDATVVDITINVDTTPPALNILSPAPNALVNSTTVPVTFSFEAGASVTCSIDGGAPTTGCSSPKNYTALSQGSHTVTIVATDTATNTNTKTVTFTVDSQGPTVAGSCNPSGNSASCSFSFSETASNVTCQLNKTDAPTSTGAVNPCSSPVSFSSLANGSYALIVSGTDAAGNPGTGTFTFAITVDITPPNTAIATQPANPTNSTSASFTYTSTEPNGTYECSLDGAPATVCATSGISYSSLAEGSHTFTVAARDNATNIDPTPASYTWSVDLTPPAPPVCNAIPALTSSTSITLTCSGEAGATLQYSRDGGAFTSFTSPVTLTGFTNGAHTIAVRQIDAATNIGSAATSTFTVDNIAPDTTITSGPTGTVGSTSASISFTSTEAGSTFACSQDGGAYAPCTSPVSLSSLSQGAHTFAVRATDAANNTDATPATASWTVDTVGPNAPTITSGPSGTVATAAVTFAVTTAEAGGSLQVSVDSGSYVAATSPLTLSSLGDGAHTVCFRQLDTAGNIGLPVCRTFTIDTTPPPVPSVSGPSGTVNTTSATITFTDAEAGATFECSNNGAPYAACTSPVNLTSLPDGARTFAVRAKDAVGNASAPTTINWIIQTVGPPPPSVVGPTGIVGSTSATITFTDTQAGATFECSDNGAAFAVCTSPVNLTGLAQGARTFGVRAKDGVGNYSSVTTIAWTVDTVAPPAPSVSGPTGTVGSNAATITFSDTEAGVTFECSNNGAAYAACTSPVNLTGLADGARTFAVRAKDGAAPANTSASTTINWTVDTTPPPAPSVSGPSGTVASTSATITFTDTEAGVTFECSNNGAAYAACTSPVNLTALAQGARTFAVRAKDSVNNTSTSTTINWIVDTTPPPTPSISGPTGLVASTSATITFSDTEAGVTFECSQDGAAYAACTSPVNLSSLAQGAHTFAVRAKDAVNNTSGSASLAWTVDTILPPAPSVSGPSGTVGVQTATITFTDTEAGVSFECSQDGAAFAACTSPVNLSGLSNGPHSYAVRAKDGAGNLSTASTINWTVSIIAPPPPSVSGPTGTVASTSATITFTDTQAGVTFECSLNGAAFATCTSPVNLTSLGQGAQTYAVRAKDGVGNTSSATTINWSVDTTPPPNPTVSGPTGIVGSTSASITFSDTEAGATFECSQDGGAFATCTSPTSLSSLAQGGHTFAVRAKDALSNTSGATSIAWTVDTVAPPVPSVSGPTGTVASSAAAITFSDTEAGVTFECSNNGAAYAACTSPVNLTGLADGARTFAVRAKDGATPANVSASTTINWIIDTTPPPAPSVSGPSGTTGLNSATITFSDTEAGVTYECSNNGAAYAACTSPVNLTSLPDGPRTFAVRAKDAVGNTSTSTTISWTVSAGSFTATITAGPTGTVNTANNSFSFTASITSGTTFECKVDGGAFALCTSAFATGALADGSHTFTVHAKNGAQTSPDVSRTWTIDTVGPTINITSPSGTTGPNVTLAFTAVDPTTPVTTTCKLDALAATSCTTGQTYAGLSSGSHTITVTATDGASNVSAQPVTWTVDATPPPAPSVSGPTGIVGSTSASISFSDTEAGVTFECSQDGGSYATCTSPVNLSSLAQGGHSYAVRAKDAFNNTSGSTTINWTVDTIAPPVPSVSGPSGIVGSTAATITFSDTEAGVTFECSQDGGAYAACTSPVNLSSLAQGAHSYAVRAKDGATPANTSASTTINWTVDTVAPPAPSVSGPTGISGSNSASISFSDTEAGVTFECSNNGAAFATCSSPVNLTSLPEGARTFAVRAKDGATPANVSGTTTISWTVDTVAPPAPSVSGPSGIVGSTSAAITFTDTEAGVTFECSDNGGAYAACTSPVNLAGLSQGAHSFAVRAKDGATPANVSASTTINWTVDTVAPPAPTVSGPTGIVGSTSAAITFTDTEAGVTFECSNNGAAFTACTSPQNLSGLAQGARTFAVRAKDGATPANVSGATTISWTVDTVAPPVPSVSGPSGIVGSNAATITFSDTEAGVTFECSQDGGAYATCSTPVNLSGLAQGAHSYAVRAKDGATPANVSASTTINWTVDTVAPPAPSVSGPTGIVGSNAATITFSDTEAGVTFECSNNGAAYAACTSPVNLTGLSDGARTFAVRAKDGATPANTSASTTISWTVDTTAPPAPSVSGPTGIVGSTSATITFSDTEAGVTFECSNNGAAFAACTSAVNLTALAQGSRTFAVRAKDGATPANVSGATTITWTVDTVAPPVPTLSGPTGIVGSTSATISISDTEAGVTFECSQDGGAYAACSSTVNLTSLTQGVHTFTARAKDGATPANTSASATAISWTVDTVAPPAPTVSGPTGIVGSTSAAITFSDTEAGVTFECSNNGAAFAACTSPQNLSGLGQGARSFAVRAKDGATPANVSAATTINWTVDTVAPPVPSVSGPSGIVGSTSAAITFSDTEAGVTFECSQDGGTYATCTSPVNLSGLTQGPHSYAVRAKDGATPANTSASTTINWTVDTVAPPVPSVSGPSGIVGSTSATITFSDTEAGVTFECSNNGAAFAACTSAVNLTALAQGSRTFAVRAKDGATPANVSAATTITWTVDTVAPPAPTVSTPPNSSSQTPSITFSDTEAGVTFECSLNGGAFATCTSPQALSLPSVSVDTVRTFAVRAKDAAVPPNVSGTTTVTWTQQAGAVAPNTLLDTPVAAWPDTSPQIQVSSDQTGVTYECDVNDQGTFTACTPGTGTYDSSEVFLVGGTDATGTNKIAIRAKKTSSGLVDPTPVVTYSWIDDRTPNATASVTPSTTLAGAHPDVSSTVTLDGGYNPKSIKIDVPAGFNGGLTATTQKCEITDAYIGDCAANAPLSYIGTLTGQGVSTRDGYLTGVSGNLYLTTPPDGDTPAGVALDMLAPNGLGHIWAVGTVKIVQSDNGNIQGETHAVIEVQNIPQRTSDLGNPFHVVTATLNLQGDPAGGTYPLLTNPTTCPASPAQFKGVGTTYADPNDDGTEGPPVPPVFVDYPVTGCSSLEFNPTVNQEFYMPTPIDGSTYDPTNPGPHLQNVGSALTSNRPGYRKGQAGSVATLSMGAPSTTARRASIQDTVVYMPTSIGANLPAFGDAADMCPGGSADQNSVFDPSSCPAIALVGTIAIDTPLLEDDLIGNVYAINKTPIPWIGIDINPNVAPTNPVGLTLRLTGMTDTTNYPSCSSSASPWCGNRVKITLANLPDVPMNGVVLDLSGRTARPVREVANDAGPAGESLATLPLITADGGDSGCKPDDQIISEFNAAASEVANLARTQNTTTSFCVPPDLSTVTRVFTNAATGAVSAANPATTNATPTFTWTSTEPGGVITCSINGAAFIPCASPFTPTVPNGSATLVVRVVNAAGTDENRRSSAWTVDSVAPPVPTVVRSSSTANASQVFSWTRGTAVAPNTTVGTLQCKRDTGTFQTSATAAICGTGFGTTAASGTASTSGWSLGVSHTYTIRNYDAVGNISPEASVTWAN